MKRFLCLLFLLSPSAANLPTTAAAEETRPNIVVIVADDLVYGDLGDWKLVKVNGIDQPQLFNLKDDIGEQSDKSASEPEVFAKLQQTWNEWNSTLVEPSWKPAAQQPGGKGKGKGRNSKKDR